MLSDSLTTLLFSTVYPKERTEQNGRTDRRTNKQTNKQTNDISYFMHHNVCLYAQQSADKNK